MNVSFTVESYRRLLAETRTSAGVMLLYNGGLPRVSCTDAERKELLDETLARFEQVNPQPEMAA